MMLNQFTVGLLALLAMCIATGILRKLTGSTFYPPPGIDGDTHRQDQEGRWWRFGADGNLEEVWPTHKRGSATANVPHRLLTSD